MDMNTEQFKQNRLSIISKKTNKSLTQKELAEELGITQASVSRIETGARNPKKSLIKHFKLLIQRDIKKNPVFRMTSNNVE